jgi:hypothetical protein
MADRRISQRILMGIGLDEDGHARVTKGEEYVLVGGSEDTHGKMQDGVERFRDTLKKMGTSLQRATRDQMQEAAQESGLAD